MPRLAILNMFIGFSVLFLAACGGSFIAFDMTEGFLRDPALLESWQLTLLKSAHGHSNLFGLLHIALGLTLPYSTFRDTVKKWQTIGLVMGTIAMGPLMIIRAASAPTDRINFLEILMGVALSMALACLASHSAGLAMKLKR